METKPDARSRRNELGRGDRTRPYEDRTRPISCSATAGVSSCDRTLSEAGTGRTDDTILRHGNVFSVTGRSGTGRPDAQSTTSDRVQSGASATGRVRSMMTGLGPESDQRARSNGQDDRTCPVRMTATSGQ